MASSTKNVRLDNIKKAREVWKLKVEGIEIANIASQLLITPETVTDILKYTVASHYNRPITKPSYYDEQLRMMKKLSLDRKKIQTIMDSATKKKKLLHLILQATAIISVVLIVI